MAVYTADGGTTGVKKPTTPTQPTTPTLAPTPAQMVKQPTPTMQGFREVDRIEEPSANLKTAVTQSQVSAPDIKAQTTPTTTKTTDKTQGATTEIKSDAVREKNFKVKEESVDTTIVGMDVKPPDTQKAVGEIAKKEAEIYDAKWEAEQTASTQKLTELMNKENAYLTQLSEMQFEYDPYKDAEYLRDAAGLENQVAQMMTGRGGLYSSVTNSALQAGLMSLQVDFRAQKYNQFKEERNFMMSMAQMEMQQRNDYFNQFMTIKQDQDRQKSDEFNRFISITEMELNAQQQAYENAFREMEYKQSVIDRQNQVAMDRERLAMQRAEFNFNIEKQAQDYAMSKEIARLQDDFTLWTEYRTNFDRINNAWAKTGRADEEIQEYYNDLGFNIKLGSRLEYYPNIQADAARAIQIIESKIKDKAFELNQTTAIMEMINSIKNPVQPTRDVTKTMTDESGTTTKYDYKEIIPTTNRTYQTPVSATRIERE